MNRKPAPRARGLAVVVSLVLLVIASPAFCDASPGDEAFIRGRLLEDRLELYAAREAFRDAVRLAPDNRGYAEHRAWFLFAQGYPEEAATSFEEIIAAFGPTDELIKGLAWSLKVIGKLEQSLTAYRRVYSLQRGSDYPSAFAELGLLIHEENAARIAGLRRRIITEGPDAALRRSLLEALFDQGELAEALDLAKGILAEQPNDALLGLRYARALRWKGRLDESVAEYERLLAAFPDSVALQIERLTALSELGRTAESLAALQRAREAGLQDALALSRAVDLLGPAGRQADAIALADAIVASGPDRLIGLLARARARHFSGDVAGARPYYREVLANYPYNTDALWGLVETSTYSGGLTEARSVLSRWRMAVPDDRFLAQEALLSLYSTPAASGRFSWFRNSSGYSRWDAGLSGSVFPAPRLSLTAAGYASFFDRSGLDTLRRATAEIGLEASSSEGQAVFSGTLRAETWEENHEDLNGRLGVTWRPARNAMLSIGWGRMSIVDSEQPFGNGLYNHVVSYGAAALDIRSYETDVKLGWDPSPRVSLAALADYGDYSDGNSKLSLVLEAGWVLLPPAQMRLAYDFSYLDFRDPAPVYTNGAISEGAYWDPKGAETHTLRLELARNLGRRVTVGLQGALSYAPEVRGWSELLMVSLGWRMTAHSTFRLDARGFRQDHGIDRSGEPGGSYNATNIAAALEFRFP